jgi:hypothetical protein
MPGNLDRQAVSTESGHRFNQNLNLPFTPPGRTIRSMIRYGQSGWFYGFYFTKPGLLALS